MTDASFLASTPARGVPRVGCTISFHDFSDISSTDRIKPSRFCFPVESNSFCFGFSFPGISSSTKDMLSLSTANGVRMKWEIIPITSSFMISNSFLSSSFMISSSSSGGSIFTLFVFPSFAEVADVRIALNREILRSSPISLFSSSAHSRAGLKRAKQFSQFEFPRPSRIMLVPSRTTMSGPRRSCLTDER